jgi:hypothetical protein
VTEEEAEATAAHSVVVPAEAGTQYAAAILENSAGATWLGPDGAADTCVYWIPAFAGMTIERARHR